MSESAESWARELICRDCRGEMEENLIGAYCRNCGVMFVFKEVKL